MHPENKSDSDRAFSVRRDHYLEESTKRLVQELTFNKFTVKSYVGGAPVTADQGEWWKAYLRGAVPTVLNHGPNVAPRPPLRMVDLFCGSGGLALGVRQAALELGLQVDAVAAIDKDPDALEVYARNHKVSLATRRSVSTLVDYDIKDRAVKATFASDPLLLRKDWAKLRGTIDLVLAGPPCQGHSNLNNWTRRTDPRNELYLTVPAIAVALDAKLVIIENVQAVRHDKGRVVDVARELFESRGYDVQDGVFDAFQLGWPQTRKRHFLVASKVGRPTPFEILTGALEADENQKTKQIQWMLQVCEDDPTQPFLTRARDYTRKNLDRINALFDEGEYNLPQSDLRPEGQRANEFKWGKSYFNTYGRLRPEEPARTITTGFMTPGRGRFVHPTKRRTLTALEAARLQGFPSTYQFLTASGGEPSNTLLAKWIGDAVPMPLGHIAALSVLGNWLTA